MNDALVPILIVAGVIVLGLLMRRSTKPENADDASVPRARTYGGEDQDDDEDEVELPPALADAPITADGVALLRMGSEVRLLPPEDGETEPLIGIGVPGDAPAKEKGVASHPRPRPTGLVLNAGDFTAARVRKEPGEGWRVETLGRDGEFSALVFDSESMARKALTLLEETGIVRRPLGDDGEPVPPSSEDFEEARRRYEESEQALALGTDDDEPAPPNEWSSRR